MAAAAITVIDNVATIESDTTGAVITNGSSDGNRAQTGELRNHGPADVWVFISQDTRDAALTSDVATSNAQAQQIVPIAAGSSIPVYPDYKSIAHKTSAGTATLAWIPRNTLRG